MTDANEKTAGTAVPERSERNRRRKILVWSGIILGVLLLLTLLGLWLTFSNYREFPSPRPSEPHYLFLRSIASQLRNNRREKTATIRLSPAEAQRAETSQYSSGIKALISFSRSTTRRVATLCTRPAERPFLTFAQRRGLIL